MDEVTLVRMGERILAVIIGGICIFLGYRLFLRIPEQKEGEANIGFPGGISVFVTRVGPGVFFALFGAAIVGLSFFKGIRMEDAVNNQPLSSAKHVVASDGQRTFAGMGSSTGLTAQEARADARAKLRKEIEVLNHLQGYLRSDLPPQDRTMVKLAISRVKFALLKAVWGEASEGWGDPDAFDEWRKKR